VADGLRRRQPASIGLHRLVPGHLVLQEARAQGML